MQKNADVVVVGLGPVGLAMAIEACKAGKSVIAITNRDFYTRKQVLHLDQESFDYLKTLVGEEKIKAWMKPPKPKLEERSDVEPHYFIQVKDLEKLLFSELQNFSGKNLEIIGLPNKLSTINAADHTVELDSPEAPNKQKIYFKHLIGADGGKHSIANMYDKSLAYEQTAPIMHAAHGVMSLQIPEGKREEFIKFLTDRKARLGKTTPPTHDEFTKQGWNLLSNPHFTVHIVKNSVYVGTEIPSTILDIKDKDEKKQKISEWTKLILKNYFPQKEIENLTEKKYDREKYQQRLQEIEAKEASQVSAFEIKLEHARESYLTFPPNAKQEQAFFFRAGDSLHNPHFLTGLGAETALKEAKVYGEFVRSPQNEANILIYAKRMSEVINNFINKTVKYLESRKIAESLAKGKQEEKLPQSQIIKEITSPILPKKVNTEELLKKIEKECRIFQDFLLNEINKNEKKIDPNGLLIIRNFGNDLYHPDSIQLEKINKLKINPKLEIEIDKLIKKYNRMKDLTNILTNKSLEPEAKLNKFQQTLEEEKAKIKDQPMSFKLYKTKSQSEYFIQNIEKILQPIQSMPTLKK